MLDEYRNSDIWKDNQDGINLRSDLLVTERALELLGSVSGKKILDVGCGSGKVSRRLAIAGASVVGVDKVEDQIDIARNINTGLDIKYIVGDITQLSMLGLPNDFDIAISLMAFLYLNEREFIRTADQIRKCLRKNGKFIYGNIDPYRFHSDKDANLDKIEKLEANLPTVSGKVFNTTFYKHPYSFVINSFTNAGFRIVDEIKPKETREELHKYPMLFPSNDKTKNPYVIIEMKAI